MSLLIALGLIAGAGAAAQVGFNTQLARKMGHPGIAAFVSFAVGTLTLLVICAAMRVPMPSVETIRGTPISYFAGGIAGAFFVGTMIVLAPRLGAATTSALIITGQMLTVLLLDHYAWLGFAQQSFTAIRALGAVLLICGVALVLKK